LLGIEDRNWLDRPVFSVVVETFKEEKAEPVLAAAEVGASRRVRRSR